MIDFFFIACINISIINFYIMEESKMIRITGIALITSFSFMVQASMPTFQDSNIEIEDDENSSFTTDVTSSPVKLYEESEVSKEPILGRAPIYNFLDMPFLPIISLREMVLQLRSTLDQLRSIPNTEEQQTLIQHQLQSASAVAHSTEVLFPGYSAALPIIPYSIVGQFPQFSPTILVKEKPEAPFLPGWITKRDIINTQLTITNKKKRRISAEMLGAHKNLKNNTSWKPTKTSQGNIESKEEG